MKTLIVSVISILVTIVISARGIVGDWHGALEVGGTKLPLVFHFKEGGGSTMDSPAQNAKHIPVTTRFNLNDTVSLSIMPLGVKYTARLRDGKLYGTFVQHGHMYPLILSPGAFTQNRPQTPVPPFPYRIQEMSFVSPADSAILVGTLSIADANAPIVLMISGSGQQNRDEELMDHKPFAVIADYLARNGVSTFRYDDRGVGKSNGMRADLSPQIELQDATAAMHMLKSAMPEAKAYGVLGHSLGGTIAFFIGAEGESDFIVSLAGAAVSGRDVLIKQNHIFRPNATDEEISKIIADGAYANQWLAEFLDFDPSQSIKKIKCPVMAVNGLRDMQVDAVTNLGVLRCMLPEDSNHLIKSYPDLNHLFQHAATGMPDEYGTIEETVSPEVLIDIVDWIKKLDN